MYCVLMSLAIIKCPYFKHLIYSCNNHFHNVRYHLKPRPIDSKSVECAKKCCTPQFRNMVATQVAIILINHMGDFNAYTCLDMSTITFTAFWENLKMRRYWDAERTLIYSWTDHYQISNTNNVWVDLVSLAILY